MTQTKFTITLLIAGVTAMAGCTDSGTDDPLVDPAAPVTVTQEPINEPIGNPTPVQAPAQNPEPVANYGAPNVCTPSGINEWIDTRFRDDYIYYDQVPIVDPTDYASPQDLVDALKVSPDIYSRISQQSTTANFFAEGELFGFGFGWGEASDSVVRFSRVIKGSPFDQAGILRGDAFIAIDGVLAADFPEDGIGSLLGPVGESNTVTFTVATGDEAPRDVVVTSGTYFIETVESYGVFTWEDLPNRVGYIDLSAFIQTSEADLDEAVAFLQGSDINDLVLDFRHNGGGYVYVAQKLASQIVGPAFANQIFQKVTYNDKYSGDNTTWNLRPQELNLSMPRIFVLTTERTASASEGLANSLRPYIDVVLIGENTNGKPFASVRQNNCDLSLSAMQSITTNANDESVLGGMVPTCFVLNDWLHPQTDIRDAQTFGALFFALNGTCPDAPAATADNRSTRKSEMEHGADFDFITDMLLDRP